VVDTVGTREQRSKLFPSCNYYEKIARVSVRAKLNAEVDSIAKVDTQANEKTEHKPRFKKTETENRTD